MGSTSPVVRNSEDGRRILFENVDINKDGTANESVLIKLQDPEISVFDHANDAMVYVRYEQNGPYVLVGDRSLAENHKLESAEISDGNLTINTSFSREGQKYNKNEEYEYDDGTYYKRERATRKHDGILTYRFADNILLRFNSIQWEHKSIEAGEPVDPSVTIQNDSNTVSLIAIGNTNYDLGEGRMEATSRLLSAVTYVGCQDQLAFNERMTLWIPTIPDGKEIDIPGLTNGRIIRLGNGLPSPCVDK